MRTKIRKRQTKHGVRWYVSVVDRAGKEHAHGGFPTLREAKARAAELVTDGRRRGYTPPGKLTVRQYLAEWLDGRETADISPGTRDLERTYVRAHILPHLGDVPLQDLGTADIKRWHATLRRKGGKGGRPLRGKTVRNIHGVLRKALADAVRQEPPAVMVNVAASVGPPARDDSVERQSWTRDEVRRFLEAAASDRLAAVWRLALASGMRRGELLGLTWGDVEDGAVVVRRQVLARSQHPARIYVRETTKTRRPRRVRFDEETAAALRRWRKQQTEERLAFGGAWKEDGGLLNADGERMPPAPWIATEPDGGIIHPETLRRRFRAVAKRAGVPEIPFHGARHSYAMLALGAGVRLDVVSRQLGHSSVATTANIYTHDDDEQAREAAERVAALIEGR